MYLPLPSWFRQRRLLRKLDAYLIKLLKKRWDEKIEKKRSYDDLLERRLDGIIVSLWNLHFKPWNFLSGIL